MLQRTKTLRRKQISRRRSTPRRGRIHDPAFLAFVHSQRRCAVHGYDACRDFTVHHLKRCGDQKNDRRVIGLCAALHLYESGPHCIERMRDEAWEAHWGISIEAEIARYNEDYALCGDGGSKCAGIS